VKKQFDRFKKDWDEYGVTIMCDSWTGPTSMSVINFLIYCNGIMFFHKSIDATGQSQDANFVLKVCMVHATNYFITCYRQC
jgi:hypothetical protein